MNFQASDLKEKQFLDLLDDKFNSIKLLYTKGGQWIKYFRHSNSLCARATRAITNHTLIGEYWLKFFLRENFNCLCESYSIKTRYHILHNCRRFNKFWNPIRNTLSQLVAFLDFNLSDFSFHKDITLLIF